MLPYIVEADIAQLTKELESTGAWLDNEG